MTSGAWPALCLTDITIFLFHSIPNISNAVASSITTTSLNDKWFITLKNNLNKTKKKGMCSSPNFSTLSWQEIKSSGFFTLKSQVKQGGCC